MEGGGRDTRHTTLAPVTWVHILSPVWLDLGNKRLFSCIKPRNFPNLNQELPVPKHYNKRFNIAVVIVLQEQIFFGKVMKYVVTEYNNNNNNNSININVLHSDI